MRNLKFRVFDEKEGVYFKGWDGSEITIQFYQEENKDGEIGYIQYKDLGCSCNPDDACGGCVDIWQSEPLTKDSIIEQFTGLCDSEGTEIFEGDIFMNGESVRIIEINGGNTHAITPDRKQAILLSFIVGEKKNTVIGNIRQKRIEREGRG